MSNKFKDTQKHEAESWLITDEAIRKDKASRETVRYPLIKRQLGLEQLDTSDMVVWDVGCGPLGGVSTILRAREIVRIDPLMDEYKKYYHVENGFPAKAEDMNYNPRQGSPDLVIVTNAMDHFDNPDEFLVKITGLKPGAYFAHLHAINNAYSHPHEAHAHNVNPEMVARYLQKDFELVWELDYKKDGLTYGWRKQPAFSQLWRKVTGY